MDQDFVDAFVNKPIADIPPEQLERIQRWLIIVFKKIEFGIINGFQELGKPPLTHSQLEKLTSSIWETTFRVPIIELLQESEITNQLLTQKIRPMSVDDIFSDKPSYMDN
jgi:hypothetical protein